MSTGGRHTLGKAQHHRGSRRGYFTAETGRTENMLLVKSDIMKHVAKMRMEVVDDSGSEAGAEVV